MWRSAALCLLALGCMAACGKIGNPVPPEKLNPRPVEGILVSASAESITLEWTAPTEDERGEKITRLDGYRVYRREIATLAEREGEDFTVIATVPDKTMELLRSQQAEALKTGVPLRKVSLSGEEKKVTFVDQEVVRGTVYVYKIVPYNQSWFEGRFRNLIKVLFNGELSEVQTLGKSEEQELLELEQGLLPEPDPATLLQD